MNKLTNETKATFQIKGIDLVDIQMNQPKLPLPAQTTFHFNINLEQMIHPGNKLVIVMATVVILHEDKTTILASIKASCMFEVTNFEEFIAEDTRQVTFPEEAVITFNSITISTVRGLMFCQFKGTHLHSAILPVLDPYSFIT